MKNTLLDGNKSKSKRSRTRTRARNNEKSVMSKTLTIHNNSIQAPSNRAISNKEPNQSQEPGQEVEVKKISIPSAVFTMFIGIVGAGCLALPYSMRKSGLIFGYTLIISACIVSYFTLDLLLISCEYLPNDIIPSYQTLGQYALGPKFSKILLYIMILMYWGALAGYVVAWSGLIDLVWQVIVGKQDIYNYCVLGVSFLVTFPLSLLKDLRALQYTSCLGALCAVYLTIVVVINYLMYCHDANEETKEYHNTCFWKRNHREIVDQSFPFKSFTDGYQGFLTAFPLIVFAYTGHQFLLPVYVRLKNKSVDRMRIVFKTGNGFILILYVLIAGFGFFEFLDEVCGNMLLNNFKKQTDVVIAAVGIAFSCICSSPFYAYNLKRAIGELIWKQTPEQLSFIKHFVMAFLGISAAVVVAIYVKSITVVFGYLGATFYPFIGYILPAIYFCKMVPTEKYPIRKFLAILQAVIMTLIGLASFIWSFKQPGSDSDCDNKQTIG